MMDIGTKAKVFAPRPGPCGSLRTLESDSHVIEENAREQRFILEGLAAVG